MKLLKLIVLFITVALISSVGTVYAQRVFDPSMIIEIGQRNNYIERYDDPDFKVKCWITTDSRGGVSCLPWSEVKER